MTEIRSFLPDVLPQVPKCPESMAERYILDGAIRFCRDTYAWQQEIDQLSTREGRDTYEMRLDFINSVNGSEVIALIEVGGKPFDFDGRFLRVRHSIEKLSIRAALQPARGAARVPDFLFHDYRDAIAAHALHRLLLQSRVEWANPELAGVYRQQYQEAVAEERIRMSRGHSTRPLSVKPVPFV